MITKDLGAVSAYAYAVEKGYTGTEAEYAELMASYASVAQQASQSAQTATEKAQQASASATSASQSASTASASATSAQASAQTAMAKASEAQQGAQTAAEKAQEASQSASTASQSAQEASQSASDAQTAKTASETAQGIAETARDEAVSARDTAQQYAESIDPENIFSAYPTDTASGAVATFPDGADDIPMKSCVVHIEPVQDLSHGDPSPDNICPISGWDEVNVTRTGFNVWDEEWEAVANARIGSKNYIPVVPNTTYYFGSATGGQFSNGIYFYDQNKTQVGVVWSGGAVTIPSNAYFCKFFMSSSYGATYNNDISINYPSTDHSYHPYTGQSISIDLGQTVYGGTLDVTSGELVVDRAQIASYNGEALPSTWISDRDVYASGTTPTIGAQVVYKLATPITITLTPQEIKSLLGDNNVWADCGDTTVTYRADTTMYINRKIAEAVSALS